MFQGFDGLMTLSRREGVDIRPTLLRVLTDLYVQASVHTADEERQFIELTSRLIDQVDDATRAAVRARLSIYPGTPVAILDRLMLATAKPAQPLKLSGRIPPSVESGPSVKPLTEPQLRPAGTLAMQPRDAADISEMFFAATASERLLILDNFADTPLRPAARTPELRALRAIGALEMAAFNADVDNFTLEIGNTLFLPPPTAERIVTDPSGEPLACAAKALGMSSPIFQRVLLFLNPEVGSSVASVYRLSRLYDALNERAALIMVAAWRGATVATARAKYRPSLYDDERQRARPATTQSRPAVQLGSDLSRILSRTSTGS